MVEIIYSIFCLFVCLLMLCIYCRMGPMDNELKQRKKAVGYRKRTKPGGGVKPEEVTSV